MFTELSPSSRFTWKIDNVTQSGPYGLNSDTFVVGDFEWKVKLYSREPEGGHNKELVVYLAPVGSSIPGGRSSMLKSYEVDCSFVITSQTNRNYTMRSETKHTFTSESSHRAFPQSIFRFSELCDFDKGYVVNDSCVIRIDVSCALIKNSTDIKESNPDSCSVSTTVQSKPKEGESESSVSVGGNPGQPFEEGRQNIKGSFCEGDEFEDIGGFSISKTQASLYKQIWAKYGHIPSTKVIPISSYSVLVMAVKDLMSCVIDMHQCRFVELSTEMIDLWEEKIKMAEKLEFNIRWLRERFETVKRSVPGMQKIIKTELQEHGQPLRAAKSNMKAIGDMLKMAEAQLDAAKNYVRGNVSGLLSESDMVHMEMYLEMGENLLFDEMF